MAKDHLAFSEPASAAVIITPVTCKRCGKRFAPSAGVDLTRTNDERTRSFIKVLLTHLGERHKDAAHAAALLGSEYTGMLHLLNFEISGAVAEQREMTRQKIHAITRRAFVTDARIDERVRSVLSRFMTADEINASMEAGKLGRAFADLAKEMRDVLEERFAPDHSAHPYHPAKLAQTAPAGDASQAE